MSIILQNAEIIFLSLYIIKKLIIMQKTLTNLSNSIII